MVKGSGRIWLGALTLVGMVVTALFVTAQVSAGGPATLSIESDEIAPGATTTVEVVAEAAELGAWTVDVIIEDPDQVSIVDCSAPSHSVCNPEYNATTVRFAGAVATGLSGEIPLGTVTVRCADTEGSSDLNLDTVGFADATLGGPVEIPVAFSPGTIDCTEAAAAEPTATPGGGGGAATPTATLAAAGLPPSGYGASGAGAPFTAMLALAAAAVVGLAASGLALYRIRNN